MSSKQRIYTALVRQVSCRVPSLSRYCASQAGAGRGRGRATSKPPTKPQPVSGSGHGAAAVGSGKGQVQPTNAGRGRGADSSAPTVPVGAGATVGRGVVQTGKARGTTGGGRAAGSVAPPNAAVGRGIGRGAELTSGGSIKEQVAAAPVGSGIAGTSGVYIEAPTSDAQLQKDPAIAAKAANAPQLQQASETFSQLIESCAAKGLFQDIDYVYMAMEAANISATSHAYQRLLQVYTQLGYGQRMDQIYAAIREAGMGNRKLEASVQQKMQASDTFTALIDSWYRRSLLQEVDIAYRGMKESELPIGMNTYRILVDTYSQLGNFDAMDLVYGEMRSLSGQGEATVPRAIGVSAPLQATGIGHGTPLQSSPYGQNQFPGYQPHPGQQPLYQLQPLYTQYQPGYSPYQQPLYQSYQQPIYQTGYPQYQQVPQQVYYPQQQVVPQPPVPPPQAPPLQPPQPVVQRQFSPPQQLHHPPVSQQYQTPVAPVAQSQPGASQPLQASQPPVSPSQQQRQQPQTQSMQQPSYVQNQQQEQPIYQEQSGYPQQQQQQQTPQPGYQDYMMHTGVPQGSYYGYVNAYGQPVYMGGQYYQVPTTLYPPVGVQQYTPFAPQPHPQPATAQRPAQDPPHVHSRPQAPVSPQVRPATAVPSAQQVQIRPAASVLPSPRPPGPAVVQPAVPRPYIPPVTATVPIYVQTPGMLPPQYAVNPYLQPAHIPQPLHAPPLQVPMPPQFVRPIVHTHPNIPISTGITSTTTAPNLQPVAEKVEQPAQKPTPKLVLNVKKPSATEKTVEASSSDAGASDSAAAATAVVKGPSLKLNIAKTKAKGSEATASEKLPSSPPKSPGLRLSLGKKAESVPVEAAEKLQESEESAESSPESPSERVESAIGSSLLKRLSGRGRGKSLKAISSMDPAATLLGVHAPAETLLDEEEEKEEEEGDEVEGEDEGGVKIPSLPFQSRLGKGRGKPIDPAAADAQKKLKLARAEAAERAIAILESGVGKFQATTLLERRKKRLTMGEFPRRSIEMRTVGTGMKRPKDKLKRMDTSEEAVEEYVAPEEYQQRDILTGFEEVIKGAVHRHFMLDLDPERAMEEFGTNPDIDDKPLPSIEETLEKAKPYIMAKDGISSEEVWKESVEDVKKRSPQIERLVEEYGGGGKKKKSGKQQMKELENVITKLPPYVRPELEAFAKRAMIKMQGNSGWSQHEKKKMLTRLVADFSKF